MQLGQMQHGQMQHPKQLAGKAYCIASKFLVWFDLQHSILRLPGLLLHQRA